MAAKKKASKKKEAELLSWSNVQVRLGDLLPNPRNPKNSTEESASRLADSLESVGQFETLAIEHDGKTAVDGHQRLQSWIDAKGADFIVDARQASRALTEEEWKKIVLYSGGDGARGKWDFDMLTEDFELQELTDWGGFDADMFGGGEVVSDLDTENPGDTYQETHSVIVTCADQDEQEITYNRLVEMGLTCRVVSN